MSREGWQRLEIAAELRAKEAYAARADFLARTGHKTPVWEALSEAMRQEHILSARTQILAGEKAEGKTE